MKLTNLVLPLIIVLAMSFLDAKKRAEPTVQKPAAVQQPTVTEKEALVAMEWGGDTKPDGDEMEKWLEALTKIFEATLLKKYPDSGKDQLEEFKKVEAEHKGELDKLEQQKKTKEVNFFSYLIKKGAINNKYKEQYKKFATKASSLQADWDEESGNLWQAWDADDKAKYNESLKDLQDFIKAVSGKE